MPHAFLSALLQHEQFALVTHFRPDGDALGSQIAMGLFLRKLGKRIVMLGDFLPRNLKWIGKSGYRVYVDSEEQRERIQTAEAVVVLDAGAVRRLGRISEAVAANPNPRYLIDHHPDPEDGFAASYVRTSASSTGELIYELITAHDPDLIDREIATALYVAIMTDTGSFRFNSVTPRVHEITADLLQRGELNPGPIHDAVFANTLGGLHLLGEALRSIELHFDGKVATMTITQRMLEETGTHTDEIRGFVNQALSVEGAEVAVLFTELKGHVKMSFRSEGDVAVNAWAAHFGGGGHRNASGAYVEGRLKKVVWKVMAAAGEYLEFED